MEQQLVPVTSQMATKTGDVRVLVQSSSNQIKNCVAELLRPYSGHATVVATSGGSLPNQLDQIRTDGIDATHWTIWFADERCVPLNHQDSNFSANKPWFRQLPRGREQIEAIDETLLKYPEKLAANYEQRLEKAGIQSFDVMLLGMGPDGHLCSLFPNHPLLEAREKMVEAITDSPKPPPTRITFTFPVLERAKHIIFIITGKGKADALREVITNPHSKLPTAQLVQRATGHIDFILDEDAASKLPNEIKS